MGQLSILMTPEKIVSVYHLFALFWCFEPITVTPQTKQKFVMVMSILQMRKHKVRKIK